MSGLRVIREEERLEMKGDGWSIYYRRMPNKRRARIQQKHTRKDVTDNGLATAEMLEWCALGWKGFYYLDEDEKRVDVPFETELIHSVPDDELARLIDLCGANADEGAVEAKNLPTSSDSNTRSAASPALSADAKPATTTPSPSSAT